MALTATDETSEVSMSMQDLTDRIRVLEVDAEARQCRIEDLEARVATKFADVDQNVLADRRVMAGLGKQMRQVRVAFQGVIGVLDAFK